MRNIAAVARHDALDAARNPVMLVMLAVCGLLAFVFSSLIGTNWADGAESETLLSTIALAIAPAYTGSVGLLYVTSEEFERGVPITLAQAGVTCAETAWGKLAATFAWTLAAVFISCVALGFPVGKTAVILALAIPSSLPILLLSLAFGLLADDQMSSSVFAVPIVACAVMPLLGVMASGLRPFACALPTGFAAEAARLLAGSPSLVPVEGITALCVGWIAVCALFAAWALRRYTARVAALVERTRP